MSEPHPPPDSHPERTDEDIAGFDRLLQARMAGGSLPVPTFLGVGAPRCGTTSMHKYLAAHPDVHMSPVKEVSYFGVRSLPHHPLGMSFIEYQTFFLGAKPRQQVGEISPIYLALPKALDEIRESLPDCKLVITLRDPLCRFVSQHRRHLPTHQIEDLNAYSQQAIEALQGNPEPLHHDWYHPGKNLLQSLYADALERCRRAFPPDQLHVILFDDVLARPGAVTRDLCAFLGIHPFDHPLPRIHTSPVSRGEIDVAPDVRRGLDEIFAPDVRRVADGLGRDLSHWLD